jgi:hypothetical protein
MFHHFEPDNDFAIRCIHEFIIKFVVFQMAVGSNGADQKCSWTGKLQGLTKHEETCPFHLVPCPRTNCIIKMQRREIKQHEATCKYNIDSCVECGCVLIRHEIEKHKKNDCPETLIPCPYKCTSVKGLVEIIKR